MEEKAEISDTSAKHDIPDEKTDTLEKREIALKEKSDAVSNYDSEENSLNEKSFIMWENNSNMCWLDASMAVLVHNYTMRSVFQLNPNCQVSKIITTYDEAMDVLNDFNSGETAKERLKSARNLLQEVQDSSLKYLQPLLKFKKGEPESAHHSLLNLIKEDKLIQEYFNVSYAWVRLCDNCDMSRVVTGKKPIITITNVKEFVPEEQFLPINCQYCHKKDQKMKLVYRRLPPCLFFHFENGAGNGNNLHLKFKVASREYKLTAVMILEKGQESNLNHFVTYIRNPTSEKWLECNDLDMDIVTFSTIPPFEILNDRISLKDVYIYVFEAFDNLGIVKIDEDSSLKNTSHNIPCIDLDGPDGKEDDSCSEDSYTQLKKTTVSGEESVEKIQAFLSSTLNPNANSFSKSELDQNNKTKTLFSHKNNEENCNLSLNNNPSNISSKNDNFHIFNGKQIYGIDNNVCSESTVASVQKFELLQDDSVRTPVSNVVDFEDYIKKRLNEYNSNTTPPLVKLQTNMSVPQFSLSESPNKKSDKQKSTSTNNVSNNIEKKVNIESSLTTSINTSEIEDDSLKNKIVAVHNNTKENKDDSAKQERSKIYPVTKIKASSKPIISKSSENDSPEIQKLRKVSFNEEVSISISPVSTKSCLKRKSGIQEQESITNPTKILNSLEITLVPSITKDKNVSQSENITNAKKKRKSHLKFDEKKSNINNITVVKSKHTDNKGSNDVTNQKSLTKNLEFVKSTNGKEINPAQGNKLCRSSVEKKLDQTELKTDSIKNTKSTSGSSRNKKNELDMQSKISVTNYGKDMLQKSSPKKSKLHTIVCESQEVSSIDNDIEKQQPSCSYASVSNEKGTHKRTSQWKLNLKDVGKSKEKKLKIKKSPASANNTDGLNSGLNVDINKVLQQNTGNNKICFADKKQKRPVKVDKTQEETESKEKQNVVKTKKMKFDSVNHDPSVKSTSNHNSGNQNNNLSTSATDNLSFKDLPATSNKYSKKAPSCPNPNCPCAEADKDVILDGTVDYFLTQIFEAFLHKREF